MILIRHLFISESTIGFLKAFIMQIDAMPPLPWNTIHRLVITVDFSPHLQNIQLTFGWFMTAAFFSGTTLRISLL